MVASQHPLSIGRTQSPGWLLRNILLSKDLRMVASQHPLIKRPSDGCFATSSTHLSYSKPWMVASQHPLRIGRTQSPLKTSAVLMFLLFCTYPQNQASLFRVYVQKSPHCSCGLCDPVRIQT